MINTRKSVGWISRALMISRLLVMSWKSKHKIRGDRGRPAKNPPMVKSVFIYLFFWYSNLSGNVWIPYPPIEEPLYSACLRQLFLLPLWSSEDSEVTSITVMEVTLFGVCFPQPFIGGTVCSLTGKQRLLQGTCSGRKVLVQLTLWTNGLTLGRICPMPSNFSLGWAIWTSLEVGLFYNTIRYNGLIN